jgi:hypothetical protein
MPLATSVIWLHQTYRRKRLLALLLVGLVSTSIGVVRVVSRRDPVVSYSTRYRVRERTAQHLKEAKAAQRAALASAWAELRNDLQDRPKLVQGDGKVQGHALALARRALRSFYKPDEAYAFDLWASPRKNPRILVLYFEARRKNAADWVALRDGKVVTRAQDLPHGALVAMRAARD